MYTSMMRRALFGSGDTATLSLDFTTGTMPTAVTFTRADTTARATFIDASGYVKTVASAGAARFDYTGGVAKGLLIEAAAQNLVTYSTDLTQSSAGHWSGRTGFITTGSPAWTGFSSPDGGTGAVKLIADTPSTRHSIENNAPSITNGTVYTLSAYVKASGYTVANLTAAGGQARRNFTLSGAGSVGSSFGATNTATINAVGSDGWYQITMTWTATTSGGIGAWVAIPQNATTDSVNSWAGDGTSGIFAWGVQLEASASASSLIITGSSQLTRLADDAVIRSTDWTSLYAQPGAMVVEFYRGAYGVGDRSIMSTDTTAARHWHLKQANASATAQIAFSAGSPVTQTGLIAGLNKVAIAWNAPTPTASFDLCVNGATPTFGGSNVGTTLSTWLTLGSQSTTGVSGTGVWDGYLNNSIKSVKYYNALTYAEMQAKTT